MVRRVALLGSVEAKERQACLSDATAVGALGASKEATGGRRAKDVIAGPTPRAALAALQDVVAAIPVGA